jgi:cytosolic iron-sulfur protein assembly protein CIAO1
VQGIEGKWESVLELEGGDRSVYSVTWSVGRGEREGGLGWIACAGGDGIIRVWQLKVSYTRQYEFVHWITLIKIPKEPPADSPRSPPLCEMIARLPSAHGVSDINTIAWCPRPGYEDILATAGDDGYARVWRVSPVSP